MKFQSKRLRLINAVTLDSKDSEDKSLKVKKSKAKKKASAFEQKKTITEIATDLNRRYGDQYNMVQKLCTANDTAARISHHLYLSGQTQRRIRLRKLLDYC